MKIPKRKVIAIVGNSGAGKSTLIELLLRLYAPTTGTIYVDEAPIENCSLKTLRSFFGVVLQDPFLFNTTIEENIRLGNPSASYGEIIHAAKLAGVDLFVNKLPGGYQTIIGEKGYRLSGGEKQRICLAQALVRNPQILILDEATSHLDSYSEQLIQETIAQLRHDKTLLVVAHRLSTVQMADHIYVLDNGKIVEQGTHHNLIQLGGRYHMFWSLQTSCLK